MLFLKTKAQEKITEITETKVEEKAIPNEQIKTYNYGKNGIESIAYRKGRPTILLSNFNARPELVKEVIALLYDFFIINQEIQSGSEISFLTQNAQVFGKIIVNKPKSDAIDVQFHYEKVVWKSGLTEVYDKPKNNKKTKQ